MKEYYLFTSIFPGSTSLFARVDGNDYNFSIDRYSYKQIKEEKFLYTLEYLKNLGFPDSVLIHKDELENLTFKKILILVNEKYEKMRLLKEII